MFLVVAPAGQGCLIRIMGNAGLIFEEETLATDSACSGDLEALKPSMNDIGRDLSTTFYVKFSQ